MKHLNYLLGLALLLLGFSWASAEPVENYTVDFNTTISTTNHDFKVGPGWGHIVGTGEDYYYGDITYMNYSYNPTAGVDGTGALYCGSQVDNPDYLVTPAITGSMTIQVKLSYGGSIKFYAISEAEDGTLTPGDLLLEKAYNSDEGAVFAELALSDLNAQRVGIVAKYAYLDNLAVNGTAEIVYEPGLTVTRADYTSWVYPNCDVNNNFTYQYANVTVTNTGERDIALGETGFSISIAPQNNIDGAVMTLEIPVALAIGESYTFEEITVNEVYDDSWTAANGRKRMDIFENIGGTFCTGNWIQPNPYLPGMSVKYGYNDLSEANYATAFGSFGMINEEVTRVATVKNTGAAPLVGTVTLNAEGCFSIDNTAINLGAGESADYTLTASVTTPGIFTGELVFAGEGVETVTIPLSATVLDSNKFYEPFESNNSSSTIPAGWYAPTGNWTKTTNTNGDNNFARCGLLAPNKLITPLLKVVDGEKMTFEAARQSSNTTDPFVKVYYSTDRAEWTLVKEITGGEMNYGTYSTPSFTTYVIEGVPAGEYYIAFESGYCAIDNVYGFEQVPVTRDVVISDFSIPTQVTANNDVTAKVTLQNLLGEAVTEYAPALYFNGVEVATAEAVEIPATGTATVEFVFVPNEVGTFPAKAEFVFAEDDVLTTDVVEVTVVAETAETTVQVGETTSTTSMVPLSLSYNNSESETVYTAEQLGLEAGSMITSLTYKGYCSGELSPTVSIWLANAEEAALVNTTGSVPLFSTEGMTKVFESTVEFTAKGSSDQTADMIVANLAEPFEYTGGALRVIVRSLNDAWKSGFYFEVDGNVANQCIYRRSDNQSTFLEGTVYASTYSMPVVYLGIMEEPAVFAGQVVDTNGNPLEGVTVTLTSEVQRGATAGSAVYTGTTDEEGIFTIEVVQKDLLYSANFTKVGYKDVNMEALDFANGEVTLEEPVVMEPDSTTGVENLGTGKAVASVKYYNVAGQAANKAFEGVNIVVTTFTDGTTQTVKIVK